MDITVFLLVGSPRSKYAHAPSWMAGRPAAELKPACGIRIGELVHVTEPGSPADFIAREAEGKPPCPKCAMELEGHANATLELLAAFKALRPGWRRQ